MSNQINGYTELTPLNANGMPDGALTAAYAGYVSRLYRAEGTPRASRMQLSTLGVRFEFDFDGATEIEILPELVALGESGTPAPSGYKDSAGVIQLDSILLQPGSLLSDPGQVNVPFEMVGLSGIRFSARATGGTAPTLSIKVTAG